MLVFGLVRVALLVNRTLLSSEELYKLAQDADIPGRSDMSKEELVEALRVA